MVPRIASTLGKIYRIAPKGFKPSGESPKTAEELLASPAHNVRFVGFQKFKAQGAAAFDHVQKLSQKSPWVAGRATWLYPYLGEKGVAELRKIASGAGGYRSRAAALRSALRYNRGGLGWEFVELLSKDESSHVRRIALTHLRDFSYEKKKEVLLDLVLAGSMEDRTYLEAVGLASGWSGGFIVGRLLPAPKHFRSQGLGQAGPPSGLAFARRLHRRANGRPYAIAGSITRAPHGTGGLPGNEPFFVCI